MSETALYLGDLLAILGTLALTLALAGVIRFRRVAAKLHAVAFAAAAGAPLVLAATVPAGGGAFAARAFLVALFLVLTTPAGAQQVLRLLRHDARVEPLPEDPAEEKPLDRTE